MMKNRTWNILINYSESMMSEVGTSFETLRNNGLNSQGLWSPDVEQG